MNIISKIGKWFRRKPIKPYFIGEIEHGSARVFERALSAKEIEALYLYEVEKTSLK